MIPPGLILTYYGDDFTGPTDVMEALAGEGLETVLFLDVPTSGQLARFPNARAVGVAGESRSKSPEWMSANLPRIFGGLKRLGAPLCHYKVCSTFDSTAQVGSIGRAIDEGRSAFGGTWTPVVVGVPLLKRYVVFGNLFAAGGDGIHRIDRHPTMSRHPSTPMDEGDLLLHLARQTARSIALFDILDLRASDSDSRFREMLGRDPDVVLFDGLDDASLAAAGRLIWRHRGEPQFVVGSSGVEYALLSWWRAKGVLPAPVEFPNVGRVDRIVAVSGSCSPVTASQIRWAGANGFGIIALNVDAPDDVDAIEGAMTFLEAGRSVVLHTALGPDDPGLRRAMTPESNERLGARLGGILRELIAGSGVRRAVVCGGDTSARAGRQLGIHALTMRKPLAPGSPLCRAWADDPVFDGLEIAFKGGQVGGEDFFGLVQNGGAKRT